MGEAELPITKGKLFYDTDDFSFISGWVDLHGADGVRDDRCCRAYQHDDRDDHKLGH
jgi:hypothetical protein